MASEEYLRLLNANLYGITFDDYEIGEECIWVQVRNQDEEITEFVRKFEPLLPAKFNNVIVKCDVPNFMTTSYLLKYIV